MTQSLNSKNEVQSVKKSENAEIKVRILKIQSGKIFISKIKVQILSKKSELKI